MMGSLKWCFADPFSLTWVRTVVPKKVLQLPLREFLWLTWWWFPGGTVQWLTVNILSALRRQKVDCNPKLFSCQCLGEHWKTAWELKWGFSGIRDCGKGLSSMKSLQILFHFKSSYFYYSFLFLFQSPSVLLSLGVMHVSPEKSGGGKTRKFQEISSWDCIYHFWAQVFLWKEEN